MRNERLARDLYGTAEGRTVYVLGSGASLNFMDLEFFKDELVIGVNNAWKIMPVAYSVMKHYEDAEEALAAGQKNVVVSRYDCGDTGYELNEFDGEYFVFEHFCNGDWERNIRAVESKDQRHVFVSRSSITSAIHLAALMGAKKIILAGHDCGWLDGQYNVKGYFYKDVPDVVPAGYWAHTNEFNEKSEIETMELRKAVKKAFGAWVYSISPFVGISNEDHAFKRKMEDGK